MRCLPEVYNEKGSVWARYLSTDEKYDNESGKTNNKWPHVGKLRVIEYIFLAHLSRRLMVSL